MARLRALPHRTAGMHRVSTGPWRVTGSDQTFDNPTVLRGWDYAMDLTIERRITVDSPDRILVDCGLPPGTDVAGVICWHATGTKTRGTSAPLVLTGGDHVLSVELSGGELAGTLELSVRIVLMDRPVGADAITADRRGAVLWDDPRVHRVVLEGNLPRFPTAVVSFATHPFFAVDALWALGWDPDDLSRPVLGAMCLYINDDHPARRALTDDSDRHDLLAALRLDIARQMLDGALDNPDFDCESAHEDESLGAALAQLQRLVFPDTSTDDVRELRRARRSSYETRIQAVIGLATGGGT